MAKLLKRPLFRAGLWLTVALIYLLPMVSVRGAFNGFMKIEGIDGESRDAEHQDWIDVTSVSFGVELPVTGAGATRTNGVAKFKDIAVTKWIDKSSPDLMLSTCNGKVFPKVEIDLVSKDPAGGAPTIYLRYRLTDVLVTSANPKASTGDGAPMPSESVSLNFTKIEYRYQDLDPSTGRTNAETEAVCIVGDDQ